MSCGCKCSYCCSCNSKPKVSVFEKPMIKITEREIKKEIKDYRKEKALYTKKQAD